MVAARRMTIAARLDRIATRLLPLADEQCAEDRWRATLTPAELAAEIARQQAIIANATDEQCDQILAAFSVHPRERGPDLLWPPPGVPFPSPFRRR